MIRIHAKQSDQAVTLYIQDNGIGIPDDKKESIFQPMFRLHTEKNYEGHGLKLAQCRRIVEQHGGKIWAESGTH